MNRDDEMVAYQLYLTRCALAASLKEGESLGYGQVLQRMRTVAAELESIERDVRGSEPRRLGS